MFNFWADLLRLQTNQEKYGVGWHVWIREAVDSNMPYDKIIHSPSKRPFRMGGREGKPITELFV